MKTADGTSSLEGSSETRHRQVSAARLAKWVAAIAFIAAISGWCFTQDG